MHIVVVYLCIKFLLKKKLHNIDLFTCIYNTIKRVVLLQLILISLCLFTTQLNLFEKEAVYTLWLCITLGLLAKKLIYLPLSLNKIIVFILLIALCLAFNSFLSLIIYLAGNNIYINDFILNMMGESNNSPGTSHEGGTSQGGGPNGPNGSDNTSHIVKPSEDSENETDTSDMSYFVIDMRYIQANDKCINLRNYYVEGFNREKIKLSHTSNPNFLKDYVKYSQEFSKIEKKLLAANKSKNREDMINATKIANKYLKSLPDKYKPVKRRGRYKYSSILREDR